MTDLTDKLAALSEAATQGEWRLHGAMLGYKGDIFSPTARQVKDCHHIARFYAQKPDKPINCELQALGIEREAIQQIETNAAFVAALVNAYHTGQLIPRPDRDSAIERMAKAMWHIPDSERSSDSYKPEATAAYDAMFDGPAPTGNPLS